MSQLEELEPTRSAGVRWIAPEKAEWWENEERYVAAFDWLRENAPVYWHEADPELHKPFWIISRNDDGRFVLAHPDPFSSCDGNLLNNELKSPESLPDDPRFFAKVFGAEDPPPALRLRHLFSRAFTARSVAQLENQLRQYARRLLEEVSPGEQADLVEVLAKSVPLFSITTLMGLPHDMDDVFHRWTIDIVKAGDIGNLWPNHSGYPAMVEMFDFFEEQLNDRRACPRDDLISAVIAASDGSDSLSAAEQLMCCWFLLAAGNHTVRSLIGLGGYLLAELPDVRARLLEDPSLMPNAVEEMLRVTTPVRYHRRTTVAPSEIRGQQIAEGDIVYVSAIATNRDPEAIENPDTIDVERKRTQHLSFSYGPHACMGNHLTRLEAKVALEELLARFPRIEPAGPVEKLPSTYVNSPEVVPILFQD
jgi:cholest-4-en-3-one 26-monooxygenase